MILVVPLLLLALLLAIRAYSAATAAADSTKAIKARIQWLEEELESLRRQSPPSPASQPPATARQAQPVTSREPAVPVAARSAPHSPAQYSTMLESEIGSRWMLLAGIVVLVLGVAFFVKYAFDRQWINETARVGLGTIAGAAVWIGGLRFARRDDYVLFGRVIAGGGLAMMFVSAWAATALYGLVSTGVGFVWVVVVSAVAAITADRHRSVGLAFVSLVFAYAAPFLIPSETDHHLILFTYEAVLAVAALILVQRHGWPFLGLASWWSTWTTFSVWLSRFYRDAIFASTEIYLVVVSAVFVAMLVLFRRRSADPVAKFAAYILFAGPVLFHLASLYILFNHSLSFLTYLIAVTAVSVILVSHRSEVRLLAWFAVALPFVAWIGRHGTASWYVPALVTAVAIYTLHFSVQLNTLWSTKKPALSELVLFQMNGLGAFLFAYLIVYAHGGSTPLLAGWMAAWYLVLALRFRKHLEVAVPHALATAFTLTAVTISLALTGPWVTAAYAAEGAALVVVGVESRRVFFRFAGAALVAYAVGRLVVLQFAHTPVSFIPIANSRTLTGIFIVALLYGVAWLYRRRGTSLGDEAGQAIAVATVGANLLTLGLLTADISSFWVARPDRLTADFSRQLSISVVWAAYAMAVIVTGFARQSATLRYLALALFGFTVLKMFSVDLLELDGVYRITGFIALGLVLLAASFLYQRHRPRPTSA